MVTPDKEQSLIPRRANITPVTAPSNKGLLSISRGAESDAQKTVNEGSGDRVSKDLMMLFNQAHCKEDLPKNVRHLIYSYLDRSTVLQKISILSTTERLGLVDSELAAKNKSYRIEIAGQRNA